MKELLIRTGTSLGFVVILVGAVLWHRYATAGLFFIFLLLACHEYVQMLRKGQGTPPTPAPAFLAGIMSYTAIGLWSLWDRSLLLEGLPLLIPLLIIWELPKKRTAPFQRAAVSLFGPLFFGTAFGTVLLIREHDAGGPYILLAGLILIWVHDAAAYSFGKLLGKTKLWPRISPGKTWEGSASGALLCFLCSLFLAYQLPGWAGSASPTLLWIAFPVAVIVLGTLGDLSISLLKRSVDVKDTGQLFPGHGGVLDRFDALLMSTPAFFILLELFGS